MRVVLFSSCSKCSVGWVIVAEDSGENYGRGFKRSVVGCSNLIFAVGVAQAKMYCVSLWSSQHLQTWPGGISGIGAFQMGSPCVTGCIAESMSESFAEPLSPTRLSALASDTRFVAEQVIIATFTWHIRGMIQSVRLCGFSKASFSPLNTPIAGPTCQFTYHQSPTLHHLCDSRALHWKPAKTLSFF